MHRITESTFVLDPFSVFDGVVFEAFDPETFFETDAMFIDDIINEAAEVQKKNLFERLVGIIKKGIKWIGQTISNIISGLGRLIKGNAKTADQIANEVGIKKNDAAKTTGDNSNAKNAAESVQQNFIDGIVSDGVLINPAALVKKSMDEVPIKGRHINAGGVRASQVLDLIANPKILDKFLDLFKTLTNELSAKNVTADDMDRIYALCKSFAGRPSISDYVKNEVLGGVEIRHEQVRITVAELVSMQKKVNEMNEICEKVDDCKRTLNINIGTTSKDVEKIYLHLLNELSWATVNIQGGLHAISNGMRGIYQLDPRYWGSIKDIKQLSEFAEECIKTGIPAKYIVNNIYKVCDDAISGTYDIGKPRMGFGRLTLIPEGEYVYKVAFNQYGVRSNKNDLLVMNAIRDKEIRMKFATTVTSTKNNVINVMEKIDTSEKPAMIEAERLGKEINNELKALNTGFTIYDIKPDAFGKKNGRFVIVDYGYIHRTSFQGNKG